MSAKDISYGCGSIRAFHSPKAGELAGWIESEARERSMRLGQGAARELAQRIGGFVTDNDAERRNQTRMAAMELDKLDPRAERDELLNNRLRAADIPRCGGG